MARTRALWLLFSLFILYGGTIPFHFQGGLEVAAAKLRALPLNPFISPVTGGRVSIPDTVQNVLLFLPFGALGLLSARPDRQTLTWIVGVTAAGATLSLTVEALQLWSPDRVSSTADVLSNSAGAFAGAAIARSLTRATTQLLDRARSAGLTGNAAFSPAVWATLLIAIAAWEPFDVTLDVSTSASKLHALARDVWQAGVLTDEGVAALQYALFAIAAVEWLRAIGVARARAWAAAAGLLAAFGLEASQIAITSRMPGLEDAVVRSAGVLFGIGVWPVLRNRRSTVLIGLLTIAIAAGAAIQQLSPFQVAATHRPFALMPFFADYQHTTFDALSHVIELVLLYAPLGFLCRRLVPRPSSALALAGVLTAAIVIPVEYLQGWVVGRYPDVTDIGIGLAGAWAGWAISATSRVRSLPRG